MSGSRDKSLQDKLKVFFKKGALAPLPPRNELVVTPELERELAADAPLPRRLRAIRDVTEKALLVRVHEGGVEKLWSRTRDLLEDPSAEARHATLGMLRALAEGQADQLQLMRTIMFRYLRDSHAAHAPDDAPLRFRLLHALTNSGKNIDCFEEEIGPFLLEWLPQAQHSPLLVELLQLVVNVVKFNATYLDEHVVHGIVNDACRLCAYCTESGAVLGCLALLEAVVSYSLLPRGALPAFVAALCRTVIVEHYCQPSWKLMRCVVGADIGPAALQEMVRLLRAPPAADAAGVLRGAVFYINMALWGPQRVPTLRVSFLAVLPAFLKALEGDRPVVTYEVLVAVASCVSRAPQELSEPAWDALLRILRAVVRQDQSYDPPNELIHARLHALITSIEALADAGQFGGDGDALLELVDACGHERPEASALRLVRLRAAALSAAGGAWVRAALALHERYLRQERRPAVRLLTLERLVAFVRRHRLAFGGELVERVAVPVLSLCALDADAALRAAAARAITELARAQPADAGADLVDLLEKILNRPFEMYVTDVPIPADADVADLTLAAAGLLELLHDKLLATPATLPTRIFLVLLEHLDQHYRRPALFAQHPDVRLRIFEMLFALRVNAFQCVGFCYDERGRAVGGAAALRLRPTCSPFLLAEAAARAARAARAAGGARAGRGPARAGRGPAGVHAVLHGVGPQPVLPRVPARGGRRQAAGVGVPRRRAARAGGAGALPRLPGAADAAARRALPAQVRHGAARAAALHRGADAVHAGDARHHGAHAARGAAGPVQDLGHGGHRGTHAGVPVDADAAAQGLRVLRGGPVHVGVRHPAALHQPVALQPLRGVAGAPRDRGVVPQVPAAVPPQLRALHHPRPAQLHHRAVRGAAAVQGQRGLVGPPAQLEPGLARGGAAAGGPRRRRLRLGRLPRGAHGDVRGPAGALRVVAVQRAAGARRHRRLPVRRRALGHVAGGPQAGHRHHVGLPAELALAGPVRPLRRAVPPARRRRGRRAAGGRRRRRRPPTVRTGDARTRLCCHYGSRSALGEKQA